MIYPEFRPEKRKWMFWLARMFGKKHVGVDMAKDNCSDYSVKITGYFWRGKFWMTKEEIHKDRIT